MQDQTRWSAVLVAWVTGIVAAMQVGRLAAYTGALSVQLDLDLATLGWAVSLITCASAALGLIAGGVTARIGARSMLAAGLVILALATLLSSLAPNVPALLTLRLIEGLGYLAVVVAAPTAIAQAASPRGAAPALALWGTFFTTGLSLAAFLGAWLAWQGLDWRGWYQVNAALLLCLIPVVLLGLPRGERGAVTGAVAGMVSLPRSAWFLGAGFLGVTLLSLALLSMLPVFLMSERGYSAASAGWATGAVALSSILGSLAYGPLAARLGRGASIRSAALVMVLASIPAFLGALAPGVAIAGAGVAILCSGVLVAHVFASVPRLVGDPARIGPANGLIAQIGSLGALGGPPSVGAMVEAGGWIAMPVMIAVFALSYTLLIARAERG